MNVKYTGAARDYSGYGEACRHDVAALDTVGVAVTTEVPRYTLESGNFNRLGELVNGFENKKLAYKVKILHTTPNVYPRYMEQGKYHVGRVFWETNKLPDDFAEACKMVNEIWTGSKHNKQAIRNAGVYIPVYIIPQAVDITQTRENHEPFITNTNDGFRFYSIFEWTERKNPLALIEAYWREFENTDNVSLTIKTYVDNFSPHKKQEIDEQVALLKAKLKLKKYAPLYLYRSLLNRDEMYRFHRSFDCFVSAHRGEGWGIPQMEAMLMGNPIISTNCGGIHEYIDEKSGFLVDYKPVTVQANSRNQQWYTTDQYWAEIDPNHLRHQMRAAFTLGRDGIKPIGEAARAIIDENFSFEAVGTKMLDRLRHIEEHLK